MADLHFCKLWFDDWSGGTMHLTAEEEGIYLRLIIHLYKHGELPADPSRLAIIARVEASALANAWQVLGPKFEKRGDFWYHTRVEEERNEAIRLSEIRAKAGKKGGSRKKAKAKQKLASPELKAQKPRAEDMNQDPASNPPPQILRYRSIESEEIFPC